MERTRAQTLSKTARTLICSRLQWAEWPTTSEPWTVEAADIATECIVKNYPNPATCKSTLTMLRKYLRTVGADVIESTFRSSITTKANESTEVARVAREKKGLAIPPGLDPLAIKARAARYLSGDEPIHTGQGATDFSIALCARPGELYTLHLGPGGGVLGMLKKPPGEPETPIVSVLESQDAAALLQLWAGLPSPDKMRAIQEMKIIVKAAGITPHQLRAIGGQLASGGDRKTLAQALRHKPLRVAPVDHYTYVHAEPSPELLKVIAKMRNHATAIVQTSDILEGAAKNIGSPDESTRKKALHSVLGLIRSKVSTPEACKLVDILGDLIDQY